MERRKKTSGRSTQLPHDYISMVGEVFSTNFDAGLKTLAALKPSPQFVADGEIFPDEIVVCVSLTHKNLLSSTTVYASVDFDPKASAPKIEELLAACIDAAGSVFARLLDERKPKRIEQLAADSLGALEDVPFDWSAVDIEGRKIHLKLDKANPSLERMTDDWLAKNDPEHKLREKEEHDETEKLFVTGPKKPSGFDN